MDTTNYFQLLFKKLYFFTFDKYNDNEHKQNIDSSNENFKKFIKKFKINKRFYDENVFEIKPDVQFCQILILIISLEVKKKI